MSGIVTGETKVRNDLRRRRIMSIVETRMVRMKEKRMRKEAENSNHSLNKRIVRAGIKMRKKQKRKQRERERERERVAYDEKGRDSGWRKK